MKKNEFDEWERQDNMGNTNLLADLREMRRQLRSILKSVQGDACTLEEEYNGGSELRAACLWYATRRMSLRSTSFVSATRRGMELLAYHRRWSLKSTCGRVRTWMATSTTQTYGSRKSLYEGSGPRYIVAQTSSYRIGALSSRIIFARLAVLQM